MTIFPTKFLNDTQMSNKGGGLAATSSSLTFNQPLLIFSVSSGQPRYLLMFFFLFRPAWRSRNLASLSWTFQGAGTWVDHCGSSFFLGASQGFFSVGTSRTSPSNLQKDRHGISTWVVVSNISFILRLTWEDDPIWRACLFKWVENTNQVKVLPCFQFHFEESDKDV